MSLKLTYFPSPGRGYPIRVALGIAKVPFEDEKISGAELAIRRGPTGCNKDVPFGQLPILTLPSGAVVTQSGAITRYAAKLANLYPTDPEQALFVDEITDVLSDVVNGVPRPADATLEKVQREEYAAGKLNTYFSYLAQKLEASSGPFFSGSTYTIADIQVYQIVQLLRKGIFEHIPADYDAKWPVFGKVVEALESDAVFAPHKIE